MSRRKKSFLRFHLLCFSLSGSSSTCKKKKNKLKERVSAVFTSSTDLIKGPDSHDALPQTQKFLAFFCSNVMFSRISKCSTVFPVDLMPPRPTIEAQESPRSKRGQDRGPAWSQVTDLSQKSQYMFPNSTTLTH